VFASKQAENWYAVQVWTQYEKAVNRALTLKGVEALLPTKRIVRHWCDRTKASDIPLFPGYVFARFDPDRTLPVLVTPKVQRIVSFGKYPHPIPDEEIAAIQKVVASGLDAESCPTPTIGECVRIVSGPLAGVSGILTEKRSSLRLIVTVELIHRSISVEVTPSMLAQGWEASRKTDGGMLHFVVGT
jgi:transcription antitermination factor NusG